MQKKDDGQSEAVLYQLMEIGEMLLTSGAEVSRVEDTLTRMGKAYGAERMNVFVITSSVIVTMIFPDGREITQTRRIMSPGGTDFTRMEALNALSRRCCSQVLPVECLAEEVERIRSRATSDMIFYLGSILAAASFAMFFGGSPLDAVIAAVGAVTICLSQKFLGPIAPNQVVYQFLCSLIAGVLISLLAAWIPAIRMDKVMIGDIMLLIPGIAMTNAVRDILVGDTISGIMRLIETFLWAGALACGFMVSICLIGG